MSPCSERLSKVYGPVFFSVILFTMSTWLDVNGVWVEMPLLVAALPEGWKLPSYLAVIIQLANVGPATYAIVQKIRNGGLTKMATKKNRLLDIEVILSFVIIAVSGLSTFLMSFLWNTTVWVGGSLHSVAILSLMAPTALSSCMSSVVFLPFMARFTTPYISAYYVGQGFSGLIPGLIGLLQGAGSPPRCPSNSSIPLNVTDGFDLNSTFIGTPVTNQTLAAFQPQEPLFSIKVFFWCMTFLFVVSGCAFYCLNFMSCSRRALKTYTQNHDTETVLTNCEQIMPAESKNKFQGNADVGPESGDQFNDNGQQETCLTGAGDSNTKSAGNVEISDTIKSRGMPQLTFVTLLVVIGLISALSNGLLPSTQSYSCLPYGYLTYTLALRLSSVAGPLASLSSMLLPRASVNVVVFLASLGIGIGCFHLMLAAQSPDPILRGYVIGDVIVIASAVIMAASFSFVRVSVASLLHAAGGRRELLWCGCITQVGSFCGAIVAFVLVSCLHVFKSRKICV